MDEVRFVEANGLRFGYLEAGAGPLVLLLHGFPDTAYGWRGIMPALAAAGYRAVAPFTRGYAPTEVPRTSVTTLEELAADALALMSALGYERAVVVGHDWGAATAYLVAATVASRVEKLVTVAIPHPGSVRPSLRLLWAGRHFLRLRIPGAAAAVRRDGFRQLDTYYRRWSPTWDFAPAETAPVKVSLAEPANLEAAIGYYRGVQPGVVAPALLAKIEVATLAVAGEDDPVFAVSAYEAARRKFSGPYQVAAMPGGHFVHRESPDRFREAVLGFLRST